MNHREQGAQPSWQFTCACYRIGTLFLAPISKRNHYHEEHFWTVPNWTTQLEKSIEELKATAEEAQGSWAPEKQDLDRSGVEDIIREYRTLEEETRKSPENVEQ